VIIPESNLDNLMLREEGVEAVQNGQFHIFPVDHIDQGIELLTGKKAGERGPDGTYPEDTVNWAVQNRLHELAEKVREYSQGENEKEEE
jgi:predicted ATP-dependent protease